MATRRNIREAFYSELESAVSGLVDADDIGQENPGERENFPGIAHTDNYRKVPMNRGQGVVDTTTDSSGVQKEIYSTIIEARFSLVVVSDDEQEREDVYEAMRTHFEEYTHPVKDASDIHSDAFRVEVHDSTSEDSENRDPPVRGDRLAINIQFQRFYTKDVDPMTDIELDVDADLDGNTDIQYTTT